MFLKMQLLHPSIVVSFLVISIILNRTPTSFCAIDPMETNSTVENLKAALDTNHSGLDWNANHPLCDECQNSGGHCDYSPDSGDLRCYCKDGSFPSSCPPGE